MSRLKVRMTSQRIVGLALVTAVAGLAAGVGAAASPAVATPSAALSHAAPAAAPAAFTKTETISRVNLVNGADQVVDTRTFTANVDQTQNLRNGRGINVSWTGAHPTGGIVPNQTSGFASEEEYPVVIMMCRGAASATSGKHLITPETCWTQTPQERIQDGQAITTFDFPPYRLDRYASAADRGPDAGVPVHLPKSCSQFSGGVQRWEPFIAASGQVFDYGPQGCAGLPPEAVANTGNTFQPSNTTYGVSDPQGNGSARFLITTAQTNTSLGCSDSVSCALVIIPIMGISCGPAGDGLPAADQPPPAEAAAAFAQCSQPAHYGPGAVAPGGDPANQEDLAVSGQLWWSASNWRNRIMVPLGFAPLPAACPAISASAQVPIYGSYPLHGAAQQWAPYFCTHSNPFQLVHGLTIGDPQAKLELEAGSIDAAFEGFPPQSGTSTVPFPGHVVQAPTAVTGFAIVADVVNVDGQQYSVRLDARLLAKLLTESYPADPTVRQDYAKLQNPLTHQPNPLNIGDDPEFQALNPGIPHVIGDLAQASAATLLGLDSGSDAMWALTSYINADPEARAWLNGQPDPWGMVVNPAYKNVALPTTSWQLKDTFVPADLGLNGNQCVQDDPVPYLNNVAAPVSSMALITQYLEFGYSDSQVGCNNVPGFLSYEAKGQEIPGETFIIGITSLADAEQYGLPTAALETQGGSTSDTQFTNSDGRSFAAPTASSLGAAVAMMQPDANTGSWTLPYSTMRTAAAGLSAYPGTMLISTDVPTHGLPTALASDYGRFLNFVAAGGQRPGLGDGQLPPGYLPMTAANGTAKMVAYTKAAAADVAAQNSQVPSPSNPRPPVTPSRSPSPSPSVSSSSASSSSTSSTSSSQSASGNTSSGTGQGASPSTGAPTPTTTPGPNATQHVAITADVRSKISGAILPLVLLIALIGATIAFGVWQLTRPTEPK